MSAEKLNLPEFPVEKDYLIVYIDILGTKERLAEKDVSDVFENVYYPFLLAGKVAPVLKGFGLENTQIKIFSDNILFAYPVNNRNDKDEVLAVYNQLGRFLKIFLSMFVKNGILFRGAITIDKLLINELMVWGRGLLTVIELEEKIAIYPRILLSDDLLKIFDQFGFSGVKYEEEFSCLQDSDSFVYFDLFDYSSIGETEILLYDAKLKINRLIKKELNEKNRPKILQKYYWFRNYVENADKILTEIKSDAWSVK